jgi:hypothetical protein
MECPVAHPPSHPSFRREFISFFSIEMGVELALQIRDGSSNPCERNGKIKELGRQSDPVFFFVEQ